MCSCVKNDEKCFEICGCKDDSCNNRAIADKNDDDFENINDNSLPAEEG